MHSFNKNFITSSNPQKKSVQPPSPFGNICRNIQPFSQLKKGGLPLLLPLQTGMRISEISRKICIVKSAYVATPASCFFLPNWLHHVLRHWSLVNKYVFIFIFIIPLMKSEKRWFHSIGKFTENTLQWSGFLFKIYKTTLQL